MKKINYADMFTLRSDGRYQGYWKDSSGRHTICDKDPKRLYEKIIEKESPRQPTFGEVADLWSAERFEVLSYKTVEAYKPCLNRILTRLGDKIITDIETVDINAILSLLATQSYAKRTVQMHRDIMSQVFNYAIAHSMTRYNPCDHATMPKGLSQGTRGIPTDDAIKAVMENTEHPFSLFALFCLYAGLRRGEALALRYEDIDGDVIHVNKSVEFVGNSPHIKSTKTENSVRDVILLEPLKKKLQKGKGYIFHNENGEPISRDRYDDRWKSYCKYIGYNITAHQLRHGYATILYEAGVQDKDAQELLGHSDITLTRNIYTHIRSAHKNDVKDKLNAFLQN